jgi:hypothetical protein
MPFACGCNQKDSVLRRPFETFREMVEGLPSKAVLKAVALERRMLEEDLALGRIFPSKETSSILDFCSFLDAVVRGRLVLPSALPMEHWEFDGKTMERLATAGEFPGRKTTDFEAAFVTANSQPLRNSLAG